MKKIISFLILSYSIFAFGQNSTVRTWPSGKNLHKDIVYHNNYELDNTHNYYDVDIVASPLACQNKETNIEKANCFITNLIIYTVDELANSNIIKNSNLKKGTKKIRVLFIIDEKGKIHVKKILGKWPQVISQEISKIIESTPKLIPAKLSGQNIPVKFSVRIPLTVK